MKAKILCHCWFNCLGRECITKIITHQGKEPNIFQYNLLRNFSQLIIEVKVIQGTYRWGRFGLYYHPKTSIQFRNYNCPKCNFKINTPVSELQWEKEVYCPKCGLLVIACYNPNQKENLWENNEVCPECGQDANQEIRACETGKSYCSEECATKHVIDNAPEGGY